MALMSDVDLPVSHVREQIASALDLIVHTSRLPGGGRGVTAVMTVEGIRAGTIVTRDLFVRQRGGALDAPHASSPAADGPITRRPAGPQHLAIPAGRHRSRPSFTLARWPGSVRNLGAVLD